MSEEEEEITPEEVEALKSLGLGYPQEEEKLGLFNFFNKILKSLDTSKTGNVDDTELMSIRNNQKLAAYADVFNLKKVSEYIKQLAEIDLATSLSKKGFLIEKAVTIKKEMTAKVGKGGGQSKWFQKKTQG